MMRYLALLVATFLWHFAAPMSFAADGGSQGCGKIEKIESETRCLNPVKCNDGTSGSISVPLGPVNLDLGSDSDGGEECCKRLIFIPAHDNLITPGPFEISDGPRVDILMWRGKCQALKLLWLISIGDQECEYKGPEATGSVQLLTVVGPCLNSSSLKSH